MLIVQWLMRDTYNYLLDELKYPAEDCVVMIILFYTPILLFVSWVLEIIIDRPAKEFSGELDRILRRKRPKPMPTKNSDGELFIPNEEEYYSLSAFSKRIWPMYVFIAWLLFVLISIEIFAANHEYKEIEEPEWLKYKPKELFQETN